MIIGDVTREQANPVELRDLYKDAFTDRPSAKAHGILLPVPANPLYGRLYIKHLW